MENKSNPALVKDFKSPELALFAMNFVAECQRSGLKYKAIVDYPGFTGVFDPKWQGQDSPRLVIKLKNLVRDLRETKYTLNPEWMELREFFVERKRTDVR